MRGDQASVGTFGVMTRRLPSACFALMKATISGVSAQRLPDPARSSRIERMNRRRFLGEMPISAASAFGVIASGAGEEWRAMIIAFRVGGALPSVDDSMIPRGAAGVKAVRR
jgi:hypothetical protein